jgi:hypothetical protein
MRTLLVAVLFIMGCLIIAATIAGTLVGFILLLKVLKDQRNAGK